MPDAAQMDDPDELIRCALPGADTNNANPPVKVIVPRHFCLNELAGQEKDNEPPTQQELDDGWAAPSQQTLENTRQNWPENLPNREQKHANYGAVIAHCQQNIVNP